MTRRIRLLPMVREDGEIVFRIPPHGVFKTDGRTVWEMVPIASGKTTFRIISAWIDVPKTTSTIIDTPEGPKVKLL